MKTLTLTGTDLFIGWLGVEDKELYSLFRQHASVETYDKQESCVLHLLTENTFFTEKQRIKLSARWKEYCELYNLPVNEDSLRDLSGIPLKEIFNRFSGNLAKFILSDGTSFFGRFQQLQYSHSPSNPAPPSKTTWVDLIKYPNFYTDESPLNGVTEAMVAFEGQIKHIVPVQL